MDLLALPALATDVCGGSVVTDCHATIQQAVDAAADGVVNVPEGTYDESVRIEAPLALQGAPGTPPAVVIRGTLAVLDADVVLADLTLVGSRALELTNAAVDATNLVVLGAGTDGVVAIDGGTLAIGWSFVGQGRSTGNGGLVSVVDGAFAAQSSVLWDGQAAGSGGLVYALRSDVTLTSTQLFEGFAAYYGGGVAIDLGTLSADDSTLRDNATEMYQPTSGGGAIWARDATVTLSNSALLDNRSVFYGGGIQAWNTDLTLTDARAVGNAALGGGAVAAFAGTATVRRTVFCENVASLSGGAIEAPDTELAVTASRFVANHAEIGGALYQGSGSVRNNAFLGNLAAEGSAVAGLTGELADNLVAHNALSVPFGTSTAALGPAHDLAVVDNNLWWANEGSLDPGDAAPVQGDPALLDATIHCDGLALTSWYGAGVDAGSDRDADLDGSPLDVGPWGGSDAPVEPWNDTDGDGRADLYDCEPEDPDIHPMADDAPYDGVDQDCAGDDDFDADGDGDPVGTDCDDADPGRSSLHDEVAWNAVDENCDDWIDVDSPYGTACASARGSPWLAALALMACRRRSGGTRSRPPTPT